MNTAIDIERYRRNKNSATNPITPEDRRMEAMKKIIEFLREGDVQRMELVARFIEVCT